MFSASRMKGHRTSVMIKTFLIRSRLATFHNPSWCGRTAEGGVCVFGRGGPHSAHIWSKCLTKPGPNWIIGGGTTPMPSGIKLIAPNCRQPAWGRLNAPGSISLDTEPMISGQRLRRQAASSTNQASSWPLYHWFGMRWLTRMMKLRTGQIPEHRALEGANLAMAMTMKTPSVTRTRRAVRTEPRTGREQRMGRGNSWQQRTGMKWGRQQGKGRGRARGTRNEQVLLNKL